MMRPFKAGDRLEDHAVPIGEIFQQLATQLAEYRALKEQMAVGAAGIPVGPPAHYSGITLHSNLSADSNATSASSSFLHLDNPRSFETRNDQ
jgi:adenylate cyclase